VTAAGGWGVVAATEEEDWGVAVTGAVGREAGAMGVEDLEAEASVGEGTGVVAAVVVAEEEVEETVGVGTVEVVTGAAAVAPV
jgi:hypothetical protein